MMKKYTISNIRAYLQGKFRYAVYYNCFLSWLIPNYIREQIEWRTEIMDMDCFLEGSCKMCGCQTTALQMANKACEKPCYPEMMNYKDWHLFKTTKFKKLQNVHNNTYIIWAYHAPIKTIMKDGRVLERI